MLKPCTITIILYPEEGDTPAQFGAYIGDVVSQIKNSIGDDEIVEVNLKERLLKAGMEEAEAARVMMETPTTSLVYAEKHEAWTASCERYNALIKLAGLI